MPFWAGFGFGPAQASGGPVALNIVRVNSGGTGGAQASPYTANNLDTVIVDTSTGNVVVNIPTLTTGQWVQVIQDPNTSLATNTVTINGVGANLQVPVGPSGTQPPGSFAASVVLNSENQRGSDFVWFNGGSAGGYQLE
jgi:hypothetical protein